MVLRGFFFFFLPFPQPLRPSQSRHVVRLNATFPVNVMNSLQSCLITMSLTDMLKSPHPSQPTPAGGDRSLSSRSHPLLIPAPISPSICLLTVGFSFSLRWTRAPSSPALTGRPTFQSRFCFENQLSHPAGFSLLQDFNLRPTEKTPPALIQNRAGESTIYI